MDTWILATPSPPLRRPSRIDFSRSGGGAHASSSMRMTPFLVEAVASFVGAGLGAGDAALVTRDGRASAASGRQSPRQGLDVAIARAESRYVTLDAAAIIGEIIVGGADWTRPLSKRSSVAPSGCGPRPGRARCTPSGDVEPPRARRKREGASASRRCGTSFASERHSRSCALSHRLFGVRPTGGFHTVCAEHSAVIPGELHGAYRPRRAPARHQRAKTEGNPRSRPVSVQRQESEDALRARDETRAR